MTEDDDLLFDDEFDDLEDEPSEEAEVKDSDDELIDDDFDDDIGDEFEEETKDNLDEAGEEQSLVAQEATRAEDPPAQSGSQSADYDPNADSLVNANDIELDLSVEIGSLRISAQELLQIQAGNLLELKAKEQDGVNLVVNGKVLARGELLRLGDHLGVRILKIS